MQSKWDKIPYTTLLYGTGGPNNYQFEMKNGSVVRKDPSKENTTSFAYSQQTGVVLDETTHGGSDVVVYAKGDFKILVMKVNKQLFFLLFQVLGRICLVRCMSRLLWLTPCRMRLK